MTPEAQRIAIAEACPSVFYIARTGGIFWRNAFLGGATEAGRFGGAVDPLNDLNACHEAESILLGDDEVLWKRYRDWLMVFLEAHRHELHATAAQKSMALLLTIEKYTTPVTTHG